MAEVIVTRGSQITLTKDIRDKLGIKEGDLITLNVLGETAILSKKDPKAFEKHNFLPENFSKLLKELRSSSLEERYKRLGITP